MTRQDIEDALGLLDAARRLQYEYATAAASGLLRIVMESPVELTPPASVEQARRLADLRRTLLTTPVYTYDTLGEVRGDKQQSSTRTWVSRMRGSGHLFTVQHVGRTIIPGFQLTDSGDARPELAPVLAALFDADVDPWTVWTWLVQPTPLLSGSTPAEVLESDPDRVLRAARRFAAQGRSAA